MQIPSGPKGTRDFFPEDMALQEFIFSSWKKTCQRYGFEPYEGPMFEHLELYTQKSGAEIEDQLYAFKDKKGRDLALRPEITPTLARMVASRGANQKWPLRWYSIPRLFRYEKMQKGRLREFFQLNMDIIGIAEVSADAELIAAAIDMMRDLGFTTADFKVRISSRTLLEELFVSAAGVPRGQCSALYAVLDKKSKLPPEEFARELAEKTPDASARSKVLDIFKAETLGEVKRIGGNLAALADLEKLFETLGHYGLSEFVLFDVGVVRGLAYYTGIVFELFDIQENLRAIAGGGRYDHLIELYGGAPTPAAGFAAGDVVLAELMKEKGLTAPQPARSDCYLIALNETNPSEVIALAQELRAAGISCEFPLKEGNVGRQLKNANAARSVYALFIGGDEGRSGMVKVKNMASGEETLVPRQEIAGRMAGLLKNRE